MFIFNFIPDWFFLTVVIISIIIFFITKLLSTQILQVKIVRYVSVLVFLIAIFLTGANWNNDYWLVKVKEAEVQLAVVQAELQLAVVQAESAKENIKIVERVVTKRDIVRVQGNELIRYIDREVIKYDDSCKIPDSVVEAHNSAVKPLEDKK